MGSKTINVNKLIYAASGILLGVTLLAFLTLIGSRVSAGTQSVTTSVNVSAACTMSATDTTHTATLAPGTFTGDIGLTNVTATCNDPLGYAIYAIGYSNNTYGNTNLISTDSNSNNNNDGSSNSAGSIIPTGTSTSGDTSSWSMKLGTGTGDSAAIVTTPTNYTTYAPVPETYTKVATYANGTTTRQAGTSFATTYGVYTSPSQPAGTYTGAVRYTLIHPHNAIPQDKYYMQDFTLAQCEVLAHDQPITVYDKRDDEPYLVQYLKDGNCWMLDNLRLGSNDHPIELSPLDTNIKEPFTLPQGVTNNFPYYTEARIGAAYKNTKVTSYGLGSGKVGVYYNYCAASGGTYCYPNGSGTGNSEHDICSAGWRMPTGGEDGEYQTLYDQYPNSIATNPLSFQYNLSTSLSGRFIDNVDYQNSFGDSWSSTSSGSEDRIYDLRSYPTSIRTTEARLRKDGVSIRCIANNE